MAELRTGPPEVIDRGEGWVEVARRYPLWSAIAEEYRLTEVEIRRHRQLERYQQMEIDNLHNPRCLVATQPAGYDDKWAPCRKPVRTGYNLCRNHGGPPSQIQRDTELAKLQAEVAELRAELAERQPTQTQANAG